MPTIKQATFFRYGRWTLRAFGQWDLPLAPVPLCHTAFSGNRD